MKTCDTCQGTGTVAAEVPCCDGTACTCGGSLVYAEKDCPACAEREAMAVAIRHRFEACLGAHKREPSWERIASDWLATAIASPHMVNDNRWFRLAGHLLSAPRAVSEGETP